MTDADRLAQIRGLEAALAERNAELQRVRDQRDALRVECDRLARRNVMLVNELAERGRVFSPEQLKAAIVKALYEGEG
jgi:hypothetical protein